MVGIALALVSGLSRLGEDLVDATALTPASSAPGSAGDAGPAADDPGIPAARRPGDERPPGIGPGGRAAADRGRAGGGAPVALQ
ncbi:hypothetical protein [Streptomyces sp. NPDC005407]|uniref:hypothetical protein n=1 Tax=Streptomyces sp. NPDC005407 TaxID=3155340 RepID=UPI0033A71CC1